MIRPALSCCTLFCALLFSLPTTGLPAAEVDTTPLPVEVVKAYPNLKVRRPIVLTHAGDGSGRTFVASQYGKILILPEDKQGEKTQVFLDIEDQVEYKDRENEEGLLGLAFHPDYKENGEFFVYYTSKEISDTSIISRFRVSKSNPNQADPASEEEIMRIEQPYWNHNGGTLAFGPDGYLYIALGDGGAGNDPHMNGQNLQTLLGSLLRIDIDRTTEKDPENKNSVALAYAIPKDNPFVGHGPLARGEIWAYGLRNPWRHTFDRKTGTLWLADVGQKLWEEINIIEKGGNYGWNLREGMHKFGPAGSGPRPDLIEPIWEYPHSVGKSITGGHVYRGEKVSPLSGHYLYADYVTGQVWGLLYDEQAKKVLANRKIAGNTMPVMSFGEDEAGEVYFLTDTGNIMGFAAEK